MARKYPVLWFMGLSAAGKSTLSSRLEERLDGLGWPVTRLDADDLRQGLNHGLGYSESDREENIRRAAHVAGLLSAHTTVLAAFITPYADMRAIVRRILPEAVVIYVKCPVEECVRRDPKGLYRRALSGAIETFTGISDTFEEPEDADVVVDTSQMSVDQALEPVIDYCQQKGFWERPLRPELHLRLDADVFRRLTETAAQAGLKGPAEFLTMVADEVAHASAAHPVKAEATQDEEAGEPILSRLRQLGYID